MNKHRKFSLLTLLAGAFPFTWEGDRVEVLAGGAAEAGVVGAAAEVVDEDDGGGLLTQGLCALSRSLPSGELWFWLPGASVLAPERFPRAPPPRPVCLTVALKAGRHT